MKRTLFILLALLSVVASAQTALVSLGKIHNELTNQDLDVKALVKSGKVFYVDIECPTSQYMTGTIRVFADALPEFKEGLAKVRPAMDTYINSVENEGYDGNLGITGLPKVTYLWGVSAERNADFMIIMRKSDGRYLASIAREATDGDEKADFFMQFESLDEIDYLLSLMSDEHVSMSVKK